VNNIVPIINHNLQSFSSSNKSIRNPKIVHIFVFLCQLNTFLMYKCCDPERIRKRSDTSNRRMDIIAMSEQVDCLIVGAGPTGLALGVGLRSAGKSVLIVEKHAEPLDFSKAILLNSESLLALYIYNLGIVERLQESGILINGISFHVNGSVVCSGQFATENTNRYHPIAVPQKVTENCLRDVFFGNGWTIDAWCDIQ